MDSLDCADASQLTARRNTSVTALQALSMWNDRFVVHYSEHFASRVAGAGDVPAQIDLAYQLALGRGATRAESGRSVDCAEKSSMANACRVILNSNGVLVRRLSGLCASSGRATSSEMVAQAHLLRFCRL